MTLLLLNINIETNTKRDLEENGELNRNIVEQKKHT